MPKPIPVHTKSLVTVMAGTAFLVTNGASTWLVTSIHGFGNLKKTPAEPRYFQQSEVRVLGDGPINSFIREWPEALFCFDRKWLEHSLGRHCH